MPQAPFSQMLDRPVISSLLRFVTVLADFYCPEPQLGSFAKTRTSRKNSKLVQKEQVIISLAKTRCYYSHGRGRCKFRSTSMYHRTIIIFIHSPCSEKWRKNQ